MKKGYKQSSSIYLLLLNFFDLVPAEGQEPVVNYIMGVASLSLLGLFCVVNIRIYLFIILLIKNYSNIYEKYPKISWIIKRYKNISTGFLIFEFLLLFSLILIIFISSIILINQMINS